MTTSLLTMLTRSAHTVLTKAMGLSLVLCLFAFTATAQETDPEAEADTADVAMPTISFGYLSYSNALRQVPAYAAVQQQLANLKAQYEAEAQRVEKEFNQKYEAFLEGQKDFPRTILLKRQTELQELMQQNIAFRQQSLKDLEKAEAEAMAPLKAQLAEVLAAVATEQGYALIINTDANACPYINPLLGEYIADEVANRLAALAQ